MEELDADVQRSLGRIEGTQTAILAELKQMSDAFSAHVQADDKRFGKIDAERNRARGAGWVILTLLTAMASLLGGAVLAVFEGWLSIRLH